MHRPRPKNTRKTKIKIQLSTIPRTEGMYSYYINKEYFE